MQLAKPRIDVGLYTNRREEMLEFWRDEVGLPYEELLAMGGGVQQHRLGLLGSVQEATYRGRLADCKLDIAFGWSGDVEIELIQWVSGDCPHREFIEKGREGMHHLHFRVEDCDGWIRRLEPLGYQTIWYKRWSEDTTFAYLERANDPTLIEFLQMPGGPGSVA